MIHLLVDLLIVPICCPVGEFALILKPHLAGKGLQKRENHTEQLRPRSRRIFVVPSMMCQVQYLGFNALVHKASPYTGPFVDYTIRKGFNPNPHATYKNKLCTCSALMFLFKKKSIFVKSKTPFSIDSGQFHLFDLLRLQFAILKNFIFLFDAQTIF